MEPVQHSIFTQTPRRDPIQGGPRSVSGQGVTLPIMLPPGTPTSVKHVIQHEAHASADTYAQRQLAALKEEHPMLLELPKREKDVVMPVLAGLERAEYNGLITKGDKERFKAIVLEAARTTDDAEKDVFLRSLLEKKDEAGEHKNELLDLVKVLGRMGLKDPKDAAKTRNKEMLHLQYQMYLLLLSKIDGTKPKTAELLTIFENLYAIAKRDGNTHLCRHIEAQITANKAILGDSYFSMFDEGKCYTLEAFEKSVGTQFKYLRPVLEKKFAAMLEKMQTTIQTEEPAAASGIAVPTSNAPTHAEFTHLLFREAEFMGTALPKVKNAHLKVDIAGDIAKKDTDYQATVFNLIADSCEKFDPNLEAVDSYLLGIRAQGRSGNESFKTMLDSFIVNLNAKKEKLETEGKPVSEITQKLLEKLQSFKRNPSGEWQSIRPSEATLHAWTERQVHREEVEAPAPIPWAERTARRQPLPGLSPSEAAVLSPASTLLPSEAHAIISDGPPPEV